MPELPEVQTMVSDLRRKVLGRKIIGFFSRTPYIFKNISIAKLGKEIKNLKITGIDRRGKNILIYLNSSVIPDAPPAGGAIRNPSRFQNGSRISRSAALRDDNNPDKLLLVHPKMSGHFLLARHSEQSHSLFSHSEPSKARRRISSQWLKGNHIRAVLNLDKGITLAFSDMRKFGKILFGDREKIENLPDLKNLGPEPLSRYLNISKFKHLIENQKRAIKQTLMNQEVIAGIGNIYADEALWKAKIHPQRKTYKLKTYELKNLHQAIISVLKSALKARGSSIQTYRDPNGERGGYTNIRLVYAREGEPCKRCKTKIKRIVIGARSAHFCPRCQKV